MTKGFTFSYIANRLIIDKVRQDSSSLHNFFDVFFLVDSWQVSINFGAHKNHRWKYNESREALNKLCRRKIRKLRAENCHLNPLASELPKRTFFFAVARAIKCSKPELTSVNRLHNTEKPLFCPRKKKPVINLTGKHKTNQISSWFFATNWFLGDFFCWSNDASF